MCLINAALTGKVDFSNSWYAANQDNPNCQYPKNFFIYEDRLKPGPAFFFPLNPAR
jgi:hypothetical protein